MLIAFPRDVQNIWFWKSFRIAVTRRHHRDYSLALSDALSSEFDIGGSQSRGVLTGALVTEKLFYCGRDQGKVRTQAIEFGGMPQQCQHAIANQVRCRLQTSDHRNYQIGDDFFFCERSEE